MALDSEQVRSSLRAVADPELRRNIVDLGMIRSIDVSGDGRVHVVVSLRTPGSPIRSHFQAAVVQHVSARERTSKSTSTALTPASAEKEAMEGSVKRSDLPDGALAGVRNVICVGSGKGGVGKSTLTANLTAALHAEGRTAGTLDADVWGYSQPRMLGVHGRPTVSGDHKIQPLEAHGGIKVISIEFFLEAADQAIVWRGPMLHKAIRQFLEDVDWGELDYLLVDLPPGTGDVSMTLAQLLPQSTFVVVTTPQPAAQKVAKRAAETARRFELEIMGVIENMSGFVTPSGERFTIFGEGGGQLLADELDVPLLGKVPLEEDLRVAADAGVPLVLQDPSAPASQAIRQAARGIIAATPDAAPAPQPTAQVRGLALPTA